MSAIMLDEALFTILFDAGFGIVQWVLIFRFIYGIFLPENSRFLGVNHINRASDPLIRLFGFMTHDRMINRVRPLYVGFLFFAIRFYILPTAFGYQIEGVQDLSLEALVITILG